MAEEFLHLRPFRGVLVEHRLTMRDGGAKNCCCYDDTFHWINAGLQNPPGKPGRMPWGNRSSVMESG
jgi:hypothetical protein